MIISKMHLHCHHDIMEKLRDYTGIIGVPDSHSASVRSMCEDPASTKNISRP